MPTVYVFLTIFVSTSSAFPNVPAIENAVNVDEIKSILALISTAIPEPTTTSSPLSTSTPPPTTSKPTAVAYEEPAFVNGMDGSPLIKCPEDVTFNSFKNYIFYGQLIGVRAVASEAACAEACYGHPYCESANYDAWDGRCELSADSRIAQPALYKFVPDALRRNVSIAFIDAIKCAPALGLHTGECGFPSVRPRFNQGSFQVGRMSGGSFRLPTEVSPNSFPWMVSLQKDRIHHCSAVLISEIHLLTSASCFAESRNPASYQAVLGGHIHGTPPHIVVSVKEIIAHEKYNPPHHKHHDIAIVVLAMRVHFNSNVKTICLPPYKAEAEPTPALCVTAGWGHIGSTWGKRWEGLDRLMSLVAPTAPHGLCNSPGWYDGGIEESEICAGFAHGDVSCRPDRGGPLLCPDEDGGGLWRIIGVWSWGDSCGKRNRPAVYTKVAAFIPWIRNVAKLI